jgi:hypothetical protein
VEALVGLDPAERALLDLSLRQGFSDEKLAELSGTDEPAVRSWRENLIAELAQEAELESPAEAERELREAPTGAWISSAGRTKKEPTRRGRWALAGGLLVVVALIVVLATRNGSSEPGSSAQVATSSTTPSTTSVPAGTGRPASGAVTLAALAGESTSGRASARLTGPGSLEVKVSGLPSPGRGAYRLWLFNSVINSTPIGALSAGGGTIDATLPPNASSYRFLDLTREGSPTDRRYSGLVMLRAPLAPILAGPGSG